MTFKKMGLGFLVLLLIAIIAIGVYIQYWGLIPRHSYDLEPPVLPEFDRPAILIFNKTNGFIHHDAIPAAESALTDIIKQKGYDVFSTRSGAIHSIELLQQFKVVIWNNVSGDVLTNEQRQNFKGWMLQGGRWLGIHASGGDMEYEWDWYVKDLLGAQFIGHTMHPQFTDAILNKASSDFKITQFLSDPWLVPQEEWYAFDQNPEDSGYEILITADESSYNTDSTPWLDFVASMNGVHPLVWRKNIGDGKMFYSAIGHQAATYEIPDYQTLLGNAIDWLQQ